MVQFLLSRNADPNANTDGNNTALEKAAATASIPVLAALLSAGAIMKGRSALVKAAYHGRSEIAEYLLDQGAEINEVPCNDTITGSCRELEVVNALSMAAFRGQDDVVEVLLDRGADAGVRNPNGKTALELAEEEGNWACVEMLNLYAKC
jgi:ankyrin repeat protein